MKFLFVFTLFLMMGSMFAQEFCTLEYLPVCGTDGKTYGNACEFNQANQPSYKVGLRNCGACKTPTPVPSTDPPVPSAVAKAPAVPPAPSAVAKAAADQNAASAFAGATA